MKFIEFKTGEFVDLSKVLYFVKHDDVCENGDVFSEIKFCFKDAKQCTVTFKSVEERDKSLEKIKEIVEVSVIN